MINYKTPDYRTEAEDFLKHNLTDQRSAAHCLNMLLLIAHEKGFKEGMQQAHEIWTNAIDKQAAA